MGARILRLHSPALSSHRITSAHDVSLVSSRSFQKKPGKAAPWSQRSRAQVHAGRIQASGVRGQSLCQGDMWVLHPVLVQSRFGGQSLGG